MTASRVSSEVSSSPDRMRRTADGSAGRTDRLLPTLALAAVVLLATWMGNADGGYFVGGWAPAALILAALVLLVSAISTFGGARSRWARIALLLLASYTAWTFASLLWSPNRGDALLGAGQTLLYLLAFWAAMALISLGASRRWVLAASALGPAVLGAFTLASLDTRLGELFDDYRLVGTVGYYNGEAAFLLVSFWVSVYLAGSRRVNPLLRAAVFAGAVLSANAAVLAQSRGAMVAMVLSLPIFFLLSGQRLRGLISLVPILASVLISFPGLNEVYLAFLEGEDPQAAIDSALPAVWFACAGAGLYGLLWGLLDRIWRPPVAAVRLTGAVALVACAALVIVGGTILTERAGDPASLAREKWESFRSSDTSGEEQSRYLSASGTGRFTLWEVAWKDFASHPALGVGTYNYEATYYQLRERDASAVRQPHMLQLEILAERGVVGATLFSGFLGVCLVAGLWQRFGSLGPEGRAQVGALAATVTYWFVHSGAEWLWQMPAVTMPVFVYLALLVSPWGSTRHRTRRRTNAATTSDRTPAGWSLRACGVAVAVIAVAIVAPLYLADHYLGRSYAAATPAGGLVEAERAQGFNPLDSRLPQREAELAMEAGDWERVEKSYGRAIRLNPEHYAPRMFLATFHERRGEPDKADPHYREASKLNPLDENLALRAAPR